MDYIERLEMEIEKAYTRHKQNLDLYSSVSATFKLEIREATKKGVRITREQGNQFRSIALSSLKSNIVLSTLLGLHPERKAEAEKQEENTQKLLEDLIENL